MARESRVVAGHCASASSVKIYTQTRTTVAGTSRYVEVVCDEQPSRGATDAHDNTLRTREFARLGHTVYLDHAGTTLFSERQLRDVYADLAQHVLGNPHTNDGMAARMQAARQATLQLLHAPEEEYEVIFTSGATGMTAWVLRWMCAHTPRVDGTSSLTQRPSSCLQKPFPGSQAACLPTPRTTTQAYSACAP